MVSNPFRMIEDESKDTNLRPNTIILNQNDTVNRPHNSQTLTRT